MEPEEEKSDENLVKNFEHYTQRYKDHPEALKNLDQLLGSKASIQKVPALWTDRLSWRFTTQATCGWENSLSIRESPSRPHEQ